METSKQKNNRINGRFVKGQSGNPGGRPKKGTSMVESFRANPKSQNLLEKLFEIANTLGKDNQHPDAMACTKLIVERLIPSLKSSELKVDTTEKGFVFLPPQEESAKS